MVFSCEKEDIIKLTTEKVLYVQLSPGDVFNDRTTPLNHKFTVELKYIEDKVYYKLEVTRDLNVPFGGYWITFKDKDGFELYTLYLKYTSSGSKDGTIDDMSLKIFRLIDSIDVSYNKKYI